jgi:hypothetical protein
MLFIATLYHTLQLHAVWFDVISAMANIATPGMAVTHCVLLSCVSRASTGMSKHGVGVEPLFFWDRGCACARGGVTSAVPSLDQHTANSHPPPLDWFAFDPTQP